MPGVSIARDAGEGRQISVRGLGPQFTRVRINGMEAMSANGGTDASGGTNRGRSFDFNTFASELFNAITVRKTASAEIEEGSLGATVDLRTARPFDYDGFTDRRLACSAATTTSAKTVDPRAAFLISNTFADGKFGALLSVAYTERKLLDEGASTVRWQTRQHRGMRTLDPAFGRCPATRARPRWRRSTPHSVPRIPRYDMYEHEQERLGVTGSLQFAPSDATSISLDALYAKFDAERSEIFLEAPVFSTDGADRHQRRQLRSTPRSTRTQHARVRRVQRRRHPLRSALRRADAPNSRRSRWTASTSSATPSTARLVGFAEAKHDNPMQTTLLFDALDVDGYSYDFRGNSRLPLITYGNVDVTNPATWTLSQIRLRPQSTINSYQTASFDLEWDALIPLAEVRYIDREQAKWGLLIKKLGLRVD